MRVQLKAYLDRWMRGDRYGTVTGQYTRKGVQYVKVKMDVSGHTISLKLDDVEPV